MPKARPTVYIVDDDPAVRESMAMLMTSAGLGAFPFASAREFLEGYEPGVPGCLVLDVRMPGMSGTDLQAELERRGVELPIIFLTAYADVPMAVGALRAGAVDFLQKPVDAARLLGRVREALALDAAARARRSESEGARTRLSRLTPREREVLELVVAGHTNKGIARSLRISRRTVETHRARIMRKAAAASLPELIRIVGLAAQPPGER
ncbi:MAG: response regulator transcription factor [Gemmatimonadetes bacterium]|nr:response regulator transcription factor [Gemmatimonadota bacterium]